MTTFKDATLILRLPKTATEEKWKFFGVISEDKWVDIKLNLIETN